MESCAEKKNDAPRPGAARVGLMTFNVGNLFDAEHDAGKDDRAFLPAESKRTAAHKALCAKVREGSRREECLALDWSEKALALKLERLAGVILRSGSGQGGLPGPDIVVLQEVENERVLERLRVALAPAGYLPGILIEGSDPRGIDQAVLSRLETARPPRLLGVPFGAAGEGPGRGILAAAFRLPGPSRGELLVFAVHLPSGGEPGMARRNAMDFLGGLAAALPGDRMAVVAGDFNVTSAEDAAFGLFEQAEGRWLVSHRLTRPNRPGTYWYTPDRTWSFLDALLLTKSLGLGGKAPWRVVEGSVRVVDDAPFQKDAEGFPARFDPQFGSGVSDHFPVVLELAER